VDDRGRLIAIGLDATEPGAVLPTPVRRDGVPLVWRDFEAIRARSEFYIS
jgi:hypothetical protein